MPSSSRPSATACPMLSGFAAPVTMASGFTPGILRQKKGGRSRLFYSCSTRLLEAIEHADAEHIDVGVQILRATLRVRLELAVALPLAPYAEILVEVVLHAETVGQVGGVLAAAHGTRELPFAPVPAEASVDRERIHHRESAYRRELPDVGLELGGKGRVAELGLAKVGVAEFRREVLVELVAAKDLERRVLVVARLSGPRVLADLLELGLAKAAADVDGAQVLRSCGEGEGRGGDAENCD